MSSVVGDIGVQIGLSEADLNRGVARVNEALQTLAKNVERVGAQIDKAMGRAASESQSAAQATQHLATEQERAAKSAENHQKALTDMRQGLTQVAAAATALTVALGLMAKSGTDAYKQQQAAFAGLETVANRTIGNFTAAKDAANSFANDGLANVMNYSKAIQDYLTVGYSLDEAKELIQISKDAAAFNRQAGLSFGEAIERMAQGVKQGNSVVSDAAGITKNLSQILKEQGYSEQDLQRVQSDAAVRQALLNGLRREGAIFAGNAAKAADTLAGSEAQAATQAFQAKAAIGEALAPALQSAYGAITPLLSGLTDMAKANPEVARTLFLVVGASAAFTAAITGMTVAAMAFNAALGPVGWAIAGIGAGLGALTGFGLSVMSTGQQAEQTKSKLSSLVTQYDRLRAVVDDATTSTEEHQKASDELRRVVEQIAEINPDLVNGWNLEREALSKHNGELDGAIDRYGKLKTFMLWMMENTAFGTAAKLFGIEVPKSRDQQISEAETELNRLIDLRDRMLLEYGGTEYARNMANLRYADPIAAAQAKLLGLLSSDPTDPEAIAQRRALEPNLAPPRPPTTDTTEETAAQREARLKKEAKEAEEARKARLDGALRVLDHERRMNEISAADEIARLRQILDAYELNAEERMTLEERLAAAQDQFGKQAVASMAKQQQAATESVRLRVESELSAINHLEAMGELTRQQEIDALQAHLQREAGWYRAHADEREQIEERIYSLKDEMRQADLAAQKQADQKAADAKAKLLEQERSWIRQLADADLDALRTRHQAAEAAQQSRIKGLQDELSALERKWAAEDRRNNLADLQTQLAAVKADTRFAKVDQSGNVVYTYDEARAAELERQIADGRRDDERQRQRDTLQGQINAAQETLQTMQTAHQQQEAERQRFWSQLESLDLSKMTDLTTAAAGGMAQFVTALTADLPTIQSQWQTTANAISAAAAQINAALSSTSGAKLPNLQTPTLPSNILDSINWTLKGGMAGGGVVVELGGVTVQVPNVANNSELAAALPGAMQQAGYDLQQMIRDGRISLRTR